MGVVNIHHNGDACIVKRLNHLLTLCDSYVTVIGVRRIRAFGNIEVFGDVFVIV